MSTDADLIREATLRLYGVALSPKRAAELAAEVDGLNTAVSQEADKRLTFDSDPSAFAAVLKSAR
jgi:hypothetical protein